MQLNAIGGAAWLFGPAPEGVSESGEFPTAAPVEAKQDPLAEVCQAIASFVAALKLPGAPPTLNEKIALEAEETQQNADLVKLAGEPKNEAVADALNFVSVDAADSNVGVPAADADTDVRRAWPHSEKFGFLRFTSPPTEGSQAHETAASDAAWPHSEKFGRLRFSSGTPTPLVIGPPTRNEVPAAEAEVDVEVPMPPQPPIRVDAAAEATGADSAVVVRLPYSEKFGWFRFSTGQRNPAEDAAASTKPVPASDAARATATLTQVAAKLVASGVPAAQVADALSQSMATAREVRDGISILQKLGERWANDTGLAAKIRFSSKNIAVAEKESSALKFVDSQPRDVDAVTAAASAAAKPAQNETTAKLEQPSFREALINKVSEQIKELFEMKQPRSLTLRLDPPELGRIDLTVRTVGQRVEANIMASNADVRALMENNREQLLRALQNHGLELGSMFIGHGNGSREETHKDAAAARTLSWRPEAVSGTAASSVSADYGMWRTSGVDVTV